MVTIGFPSLQIVHELLLKCSNIKILASNLNDMPDPHAPSYWYIWSDLLSCPTPDSNWVCKFGTSLYLKSSICKIRKLGYMFYWYIHITNFIIEILPPGLNITPGKECQGIRIKTQWEEKWRGGIKDIAMYPQETIRFLRIAKAFHIWDSKACQAT